MYSRPDFPTSRTIHARARVQPRRNPMMAMSLYMILSGILALWIAYLPTLINSALEALNVVPTHVAFAPSVGGKPEFGLSPVQFDARWKALAENTLLNLGDEEDIEVQPSAETSDRAQVGCEALSVKNFAASKASCLMTMN